MKALGFVLLVGGTLLFVYLFAAGTRLLKPGASEPSSPKPFSRYYALLAVALLLVLLGYGILRTRGYW
jgi:hypothetical protein